MIILFDLFAQVTDRFAKIILEVEIGFYGFFNQPNIVLKSPL